MMVIRKKQKTASIQHMENGNLDTRRVSRIAGGHPRRQELDHLTLLLGLEILHIEVHTSTIFDSQMTIKDDHVLRDECQRIMPTG